MFVDAQYIFIDVDGTLVTYENKLPKSAVNAIKEAQSNGHKVYTVTGRSKAEMYEDILAVGFDGYIGGNGSYIESNDTIVSEKTLSYEQCKLIVDWLNEKKLSFYLESNQALIGSEHFETVAETAIRLYSASKGKSNGESIKVKDVFPDMIYGENLYRNNINKISFLLNSYADYLDAQKHFSNLKVSTWGGAGETALFGDIALDNIDKGTAIKQLMAHLHESKRNTIAFGDAKVDIPMLDFCRVGVAMGNGGTEIKEMADHITDDVSNDGLYKAFKFFNLI